MWKILEFLNNPLYYFRQRFWRKHHVIYTGLEKWKWSDTQYRMLYGMMSLLVQFIKDEEPLKHTDWDAMEHTKEAKEEFMAIYKWWLEYEHRLEDIGTAMNAYHEERFKGCPDKDWLKHIKKERSPKANKLWEELNGMEETLELETTDMLCRLVKIRGYLWT